MLLIVSDPCSKGVLPYHAEFLLISDCWTLQQNYFTVSSTFYVYACLINSPNPQRFPLLRLIARESLFTLESPEPLHSVLFWKKEKGSNVSSLIEIYMLLNQLSSFNDWREGKWTSLGSWRHPACPPRGFFTFKTTDGDSSNGCPLGRSTETS